MILLDTGAIIAFLQEEEGDELVKKLLVEGDCYTSAINWVELGVVAGREGFSIAQVQGWIEVLAFDAAAALASVQFSKPGISLGDRCCLGHAASLGTKDNPTVVWTADQAWTGLGLGDIDPRVTVKQVR